jgi:hypothetical protein
MESYRTVAAKVREDDASFSAKVASAGRSAQENGWIHEQICGKAEFDYCMAYAALGLCVQVGAI